MYVRLFPLPKKKKIGIFCDEITRIQAKEKYFCDTGEFYLKTVSRNCLTVGIGRTRPCLRSLKNLILPQRNFLSTYNCFLGSFINSEMLTTNRFFVHQTSATVMYPRQWRRALLLTIRIIQRKRINRCS